MGFEAAVVGSGFGGAILTGSMARKWGQKVVFLERGKRYSGYSRMCIWSLFRTTNAEPWLAFIARFFVCGEFHQAVADIATTVVAERTGIGS